MSTEQPGLFDNQEQSYEPQPAQPADAKQPYIPFIPGVKEQECYPEITSLAELKSIASACSLCRLRSTCTQVVFGEGRDDSRILFIGEGPGKDEDEKGRPFVGRAGQLLDQILNAASFTRQEVYIANIVKCRPPGNRLPNPDEVKQCRNFLEAQIRLIKPEIIVCLGAMASQVIIDPRARISQIRGKWFTRQDIKIMATFHPAALLRNASYKRPTWEDFKVIRDEYNK